MRNPAFYQREENHLLETLTQMLQSPFALAVLAIQFILGLLLGYISVKVLKYIIAFIIILILGILLNVWSLSLNLESLTRGMGDYASKAKDLIFGLAGTLGLLTIGPIAIGFIVGALIAWIRR
ncbi:MAG: hypothetical protein QXN96_06125 [Candidatus Bathyarchaeia archaeon]